MYFLWEIPEPGLFVLRLNFESYKMRVVYKCSPWKIHIREMFGYQLNSIQFSAFIQINVINKYCINSVEGRTLKVFTA